MSTRLKIVWIATLFNLSFEFAFRGIKGIMIKPGFILFLASVYFAYFFIVEHLIRRYRITNKQLLLIAFCFGLLPMTFLTGAVFTPPLIAGINLFIVFAVNIIWWGFTQGLLTFYLANRLVPRNWDEPPASGRALRLAAGYLTFIFVANFLTSKVLPHGPGIGYLVILAAFFVLYGYLRKKLKGPQQPVYEFSRSLLLDLLSLGSVIVFIYAGLVLAQNVAFQPEAGSIFSLASKRLASIWTDITLIGILFYYLKNRKAVTI